MKIDQAVIGPFRNKRYPQGIAHIKGASLEDLNEYRVWKIDHGPMKRIETLIEQVQQWRSLIDDRQAKKNLGTNI